MSIKELVEIKEEEKLEIPKKFKVVLLNDDYTGMDFVVEVLIKIFNHNLDDAVNIMLKIHNEGRGICGVYTYDIAETKIAEVSKLAKTNQYPLRAILEEE